MAGGAAVWCWCDVLPVCCCPVLYSYVGRGGGRSPTGAASSARRGAAAGRGLSSVQRRAGHHRPGAGRRRGVACPAFSGGRVRSSHRRRGRGVIHGKAAHGNAAHGKRATKKEVNAARAVSTSFFASNFRAAGITRRRCCCRPRWVAGIRRAPCGRRKRP